MQMFAEQLAIHNLQGKVDPSRREYMSKAEAFQVLRELCEEDFGDDVQKWTDWVELKYARLSKAKCD